MSQLFRLFICFSCLLFCSLNILAQEISITKWFYLGISADGEKYYFPKEFTKVENGNMSVWLKVLYEDQSYTNINIEIDCSGKKFRTPDIYTYSSSDKLLGVKKDLSWSFIAPDTVGESLRLILCEKQTETARVEIISIKANLRKRAGIESPILKTVKKGTLFTLSYGKRVGGWYNIVDEDTQEDYWVHGNNIKIISSKKK